MEVLADLLPPSHVIKSENAAKDRQQKHYKKAKHLYAYSGSAAVKESVNACDTWDQVERRSGEDRRLQKESRGRWLDSRAEKDRRQLSQALFVKI